MADSIITINGPMTPQRIVYDSQPRGYTIPVIHHTPLIVFDSETPGDSQIIHVDKRHYEVRFLDETESSVEICISRK
jgi:hypothetical protein